METTGKNLVEHWTWAAEKGLMNKNTAHGLRMACTQVLSALDDWESADVKNIDVEETFRRFQNLKARRLKPAVLKTYKRRFEQAIASYLRYAEDPAGWKPGITERGPTDKPSNGGSKQSNGGGRSEAPRQARLEIPQTGLVEYPFPIREGVIARLVLPRDLKTSETKRLAAFLTALAIDAEGANTAASS